MAPTDNQWKIQVPQHSKAEDSEEDSALIKMINALNIEYNIRKNVVHMRVELSHRLQPEYWLELNDQVIDTILIQYQSQKFRISKSTLESVMNSWYVRKFDPILSYFELLPKWDDIDRLKELIDTIKTENQPAWEYYFPKWMVGMVRCSIMPDVTNQQMLVFYSKQGKGKTRWINKLLPKALRPYFFSGHANLEDQVFQLKLGTNMLVFFDELDAYTGNKQALIKSTITQEIIKIRMLFDNYDTVIQRRASFIAAINHEAFLHDLSGSRRFLVNECLEINHNHSLDMDLIYAQVYHMAKDPSFVHFFVGDEINQIESNNDRFKVKTETEMGIERFFKPATDDAVDVFILTASEVVQFIKEKTGNKFLGSAYKVGEILNKMGFKRTSRNTGNDKRYGYLMMNI